MKPTILLVDDNSEILEVLAEDLGERYNVRTALNGRQALDLLSQDAVQLIVSDVMMPVMDGFELCRLIKSDFEHSHIPVILLTAKNSLQSKIEGLEMGADAYIEKPFDTDHLLAQIASLLGNRNKVKAYFAQSPLVHLKSIAPTRQDEAFLDKLNEAIHANLEDHDLDVDKLARLMNMSRTNLFRKVKSMSDLTPNELIKLTRLKKAAELLAEGNYKIYEVCDMVGYGTQTNFGRNFFSQFGMTPTDFQKRMHSGREGP